MIRNRSRRRLLAALGGVLMLAGAGTTGTALAAHFRTVLTGANVPGGDPDGWGRFRFRIDDTLNTLCGDLEVREIGQVTSAQVYRGGPGEAGAPVVDIDLPGSDNDSDDCDTIGDTLADEIQANPAGFFVLIKTAEFPNGALRGQIGPSDGSGD